LIFKLYLYHFREKRLVYGSIVVNGSTVTRPTLDIGYEENERTIGASCGTSCLGRCDNFVLQPSLFKPGDGNSRRKTVQVKCRRKEAREMIRDRLAKIRRPSCNRSALTYGQAVVSAEGLRILLVKEDETRSDAHSHHMQDVAGTSQESLGDSDSGISTGNIVS
jgi:hypothetical protein